MVTTVGSGFLGRIVLDTTAGRIVLVTTAGRIVLDFFAAMRALDFFAAMGAGVELQRRLSGVGRGGGEMGIDINAT